MRLRRIEVVRGAWGLAVLTAPRVVLTRLFGATADRDALAIMRVLGARQLTQAALSGTNPTPEVLALGVWVDAVHAGTAAALALADPAWARAGVSDAVVAATWARIGMRDLRAGRTASKHDRVRDRLAVDVLRRVPFGDRLLAARPSSSTRRRRQD